MTDREKTLLLNCMRENIGDATHAEDHIFRVTNAARDIARTEQGVDEEALFCACLLHDIGRRRRGRSLWKTDGAKRLLRACRR